jgi:hypothetical protein
VMRTPVKVQNGQIVLRSQPSDNIAKKYPFIKLDSSHRMQSITAPQNMVLTSANEKLLKQYNGKQPPSSVPINPQCPLHGQPGHVHGSGGHQSHSQNTRPVH